MKVWIDLLRLLARVFHIDIEPDAALRAQCERIRAEVDRVTRELRRDR